MNNMSQTTEKKKKLLLWGGIGLVVVVVIAIVLGVCLHNSSIAHKWQEQYDLGMRFLSDGDYEQAVIAFEAAISIDARNADAYIALADAYISLDDLDAAENVLEDAQGQIEDERIGEKLKSIRELRENQNAEPDETPVEEEEPVEEIEEVSLDDITLYIPVVTEAIDSMYDSGNGLLYDMDQDGVEELVLLYSRWVDGAPYQVVSAYDLENGEVVPIVDTLKLMILAGAGSGQAGFVQIEENDYLMVTYSSYDDVSGVTEYRLYDAQTKEMTDTWRFVEDDWMGFEGDPNLIYEHNDEECTADAYYDFVRAIEPIKMIAPVLAYEETVTQDIMSLEELLDYLEASLAEEADGEESEESVQSVGVRADNVDEAYAAIISDGGYTQYNDGELANEMGDIVSYAILDINGDDTPELLLDTEGDGMGYGMEFGAFYVCYYDQSSGEVSCAGWCYYYKLVGVSYSPINQALVFSETRTSSEVYGYEFYQFDGQTIEFLKSVSHDPSGYYVGNGSASQAEYEAALEDMEEISWNPLG